MQLTKRRPAPRRALAPEPSPGRAFQGIAYSFGVGSLSLLSGIVLLPIVASQVGAGPYGLWLFLISITTYVGYGDLGVASAIVHFGSRSRGGDSEHSLSELLTAGVVWSFATMVVVVPVYVWLAWMYTGSHMGAMSDPQGTRLFLVTLGAIVAGMAVVRPFGGALIGSGLMLWSQRIGLGALVFRVVGTLVAVFGFGTVTAVAVVETLATVLPAVVVMAIVLVRVARLRLSRGMWPTLKLMLGYSTKSLLMGLSQTIVLQGGTLIVGVVQGPAQVTYFNLAFRVYSGFRQLVAWILEPFRSVLSRVGAVSLREHLKVIGSLSFATLSLTTVGAVTFGLCSRFLAEVWVGDHMPAAEIATVATVLLAGLVLESLHWPWVLAGDTAGKPGIFLVPQLLWAAVFLAVGFLLGRQWGTVGVALAMSAPLIVLEPLFLMVAQRSLGMRLDIWWSKAVGPVVAFTAPALGVAALTWTFTLVSARGQIGWLPALVFAVTSLLSLYVMRGRLPLADLVVALRSRM